MFLTREIQNAIALQNQTIAVFFDLEKAYDTTWRGGILMQLVEWDIKGNMFSCINDFLSERYLKVKVALAFPLLILKRKGCLREASLVQLSLM